MRSSGVPAMRRTSFWYICGVTGIFAGTSCCCGARVSRPRAALRCPVSREMSAAIGLHRQLLHRQVADAERLPEACGGLLEVDDALRVGHLVDAVEARYAAVFEPARDALVGAQHELFDEPMRPSALGLDDGLHVAVGVELHDRLGQVEVDGAASHALGVEPQRKCEHVVERLEQRGLLEPDALALGKIFRSASRDASRWAR